MEFTPFPKIARWNRDTIITEKIDGVNAQIFIREFDSDIDTGPDHTPWIWGGNSNPGGPYLMAVSMFAGSKSRWLTPGNKTDNFGFAQWVEDHGDELMKLGLGHHFGEWWGQGIQRGYGLDEKRFSLFDVVRWQGNPDLPECCHVVPVLGMYTRMPSTSKVEGWIYELRISGSRAANFDRPEGVVIYHRHSNTAFKVTLEGDEGGKG